MSNQRGPWEIPDQIDRSAVSLSLAKAIAFKNAGNDLKAAWWARQLVHQLECAEILNTAGDVDLIWKESSAPLS